MADGGEGHRQRQARKAKPDDSDVRTELAQPFSKVRAFGWG
jgi:hypothetical protein